VRGVRTVLSALLLTLVALGSNRQAGAQAEPPLLTLDDALARARKTNTSITVEKARLAQAQTNLDQAWAVLLPTVAAQGKYTRNYNTVPVSFPSTKTPSGMLVIQPPNQLDGVISFTAPIIVPAAYPGLESVKAGVRSSEASYEVSERDVLFGTPTSRSPVPRSTTPRPALPRGPSPRSTSIGPSSPSYEPNSWSGKLSTPATRPTGASRR